jgi:hypothetical protein
MELLLRGALAFSNVVPLYVALLHEGLRTLVYLVVCLRMCLVVYLLVQAADGGGLQGDGQGSGQRTQGADHGLQGLAVRIGTVGVIQMVVGKSHNRPGLDGPGDLLAHRVLDGAGVYRHVATLDAQLSRQGGGPPVLLITGDGHLKELEIPGEKPVGSMDVVGPGAGLFPECPGGAIAASRRGTTALAEPGLGEREKGGIIGGEVPATERDRASAQGLSPLISTAVDQGHLFVKGEAPQVLVMPEASILRVEMQAEFMAPAVEIEEETAVLRRGLGDDEQRGTEPLRLETVRQASGGPLTDLPVGRSAMHGVCCQLLTILREQDMERVLASLNRGILDPTPRLHGFALYPI